MDEQLRLPITVVDRGPVDVPVRGLERLGDTDEWGSLILRLLEASGMPVSRYRMLGGGQAVSVEVGPLELRGHGDCLADFVTELFLEAMRLRPLLGAA